MNYRATVTGGRMLAFVLILVAALVPALSGVASGATAAALTRYPYLTDSIQSSITINWATDTSGSTGAVTWGPPGSCAANTKAATRTSMTVISKAEYQWTATIPVAPDTTYCYRVQLGSTDLLGSDTSPTFTSQVAAGSTASFSFDVFGDWGQAYANGNPDQTNVLHQMSLSGARFAVMTGDTAYPGGGQKEYGDLQQAGVDQSTVFGPSFWAVPGRSLPVFNVTGNHGFTGGATQVLNWPETNAAATSGGRYKMETYPSINGTTAKSYPSMWYAFDAGNARFYALTASWADGNNGTATVYQNDRDQHWTVNSAEYQWLKADLAAHPNALKFAFWHYPLYADSGSQPSDTFLQGGTGTLQGLLDQNNVAIAFNGHAHGYERNKPDSAGLVSYVFGNGGAAMGSVSGCSSFDAYALGSGGSHCGAAPAGQSLDHVFGFAKVTVNGRQVIVTPTDEMGRTFDVQTYNFSTGPADTQKPTPPTTVTATAVSTGRVDVSWSGASDNVGVTGYRVFRDGVQLTEQPGTTFSDRTVAPASTYSYTVVAIDAAGNVSLPSAPATVSTTGAPDGTPPSQPGGLTGTAPSSSQVSLSWTASSDNVAVIAYNVYRNGTLLPTATTPDGTPATTYADDTASPGTAYTYQVSAVDAAGNESTKASVNVSTPGGSGGTLTFTATEDATVDASKPTTNYGATSRLTVDNSPVNYSLLKFNVSGTAGCAISGAKLRMTVGSTTNDNSPYGGDLYGMTNSWSESSVTWNTAPAATTAKISSVASAVALNTGYLFDAKPLIAGDGPVSMLIKSTSSDGARYFSKESGTSAQVPQLQVTCAGDSTPPTQPGNLTATAPSSTRVDLSWSASSDNVGVTGYKVYRNQSATALATLPATATSYADNTAKPATAYTYQVTALDAVGNQSTRASAAVTTPSAGDDFSMNAAPTSLSITAGRSGTSTISTAVTSGNAQTVALTAAGAPTGTTVAFAPASITAGQASTMTVTTSASTSAGSYPITVTATGTSATHTSTVNLTVNAVVTDDFSVGASPSSISVTVGQSGTSTISTAVTSGSAQTVALTAAGAPAGTTVAFAPASITAGQASTMTVTTSASTSAGSYPITVTATGTSATHTSTVNLTVNAVVTDDFSVGASPSSISVTVGQSGTSTISTAVTSGSAQTVALTAAGAPAGTTVAFAPASITAGQASTMTVTTSASTSAGSYPITVTATGTSATHTSTVNLTVNAVVTDDFSVGASPVAMTLTAGGQSGTSTISTAVTSGSAQTVALTAAGAPAGTTVAFAPASINTGQTSTMTVTATASTPAGSYPITVTATGASATHTTRVSLTVRAASAPQVQLIQSAAGTATATTTGLTATLGAPATAGDLLVLSASVYTGATNHLTSITDSAGGTWTRIGTYSVSGHNSDGEMWYSVASSPVTAVTAHTSSAASMVFQVQEFAGLVATSPLDTSVGTSNTGTAPNSGALTPSAPHDLVVGFLAGHGNAQTMAITTPGYTVQPMQTTTGTVVTVRTAYQVLSSASAIGVAGSLPTAMYWAAGVAAFRTAQDSPAGTAARARAT